MDDAFKAVLNNDIVGIADIVHKIAGRRISSDSVVSPYMHGVHTTLFRSLAYVAVERGHCEMFTTLIRIASEYMDDIDAVVCIPVHCDYGGPPEKSVCELVCETMIYEHNITLLTNIMSKCSPRVFEWLVTYPTAHVILGCAVSANHIELVRLVINAGYNKPVNNEWTVRIFGAAVRYGSLEIWNLLVATYPTATTGIASLLFISAVEHQKLDIAVTLIPETPPHVHLRVLDCVSKRGDETVVRWFFDHNLILQRPYPDLTYAFLFRDALQHRNYAFADELYARGIKSAILFRTMPSGHEYNGENAVDTIRYWERSRTVPQSPSWKNVVASGSIALANYMINHYPPKHSANAENKDILVSAIKHGRVCILAILLESRMINLAMMKGRYWKDANWWEIASKSPDTQVRCMNLLVQHEIIKPAPRSDFPDYYEHQDQLRAILRPQFVDRQLASYMTLAPFDLFELIYSYMCRYHVPRRYIQKNLDNMRALEQLVSAKRKVDLVDIDDPTNESIAKRSTRSTSHQTSIKTAQRPI